MTLSPTNLFYMALGLLTIVILVYINRHLFKPGGRAGGVSVLEWVYYLIALAALGVGWYYNLQYMQQYGAQATWSNWTKLLFVNPASASGGQDLLFANVLLLPIWTIIDARRSKMPAGWWYFVMSLITSYAFAFAVFLALRERQLRWNQAS